MALPPGSGFARALRQVAPSLSRRLFPSHAQALRNRAQVCHVQPPNSRNLRSIATTELAQRIGLRARVADQTRPFSQYRVLGQPQSQALAAQQRAASFFPQSSSNAVAYWLLASAASVFGIVVFGGLTRLTESGLSITEWRPVTGSLPPLSDADWESEFTKYKSSPEFHLLNSRMTLEEFKSIYWMEWIHRLWGRAVGLTFILPAVYFIARKRVSKPMTLRLAGIAGLIGFQGVIGWWMVKSGLKDDLFAPGSHPRVSQYRLAAHLGTAFVCYLAMLWNGLNILRTNKLLSLPADVAASTLYSLRNPMLKPFKVSVALLAGLMFTTAMSGALVAGLDAGLIYNEFPYMGEGLVPPTKELLDPFYSRDKVNHSDLWWRNMLENPTLVQLDHRILATTTFTSVMALWAYSRFSQNVRTFLPKAAARGVHGVVGFAWLQVILGITTLMWLVPLPLASAHQAGALALLTWTTILGSRIWYPQAAARILQQRLNAATGASAARSFPAIAKVAPNLGTASATVAHAPLTQASFSMVAAVTMLAVINSSKRKEADCESSGLSKESEKLVFLDKQRTFRYHE